MERTIGIILLIVGLAGIAYLYNSIPSILSLDPNKRTSSFLAPPQLPSAPYTQRGTVTVKGSVAGTVGGSVGAGVSGGVSGKVQTQAVAPANLFHAVRISGVHVYNYANPPYAEVDLYSDTVAPLDVTGWKIKSKTDSFVIPQAYKYYMGTGSSFANIAIKRNDRLTLYTHTGAIIPGFNINKCMGYLARTITFNPSFYGSCPALDLKNIADYSSQCQEYVRTLGSCTVPISNPPIRPDDYQCQAFLQKIKNRWG